MSEIQENPSTTKEVMNSTQAEITPISDFNFSISVNIHVKADPELVAALQKIASCLERISPVRYSSEEVSIEVPENPIDRGTSEKPYGRIVYRGDEPDTEWTKIPQNKRLVWKEEKSSLYIKYYDAIVRTTWADVERIAKIETSVKKGAAIKELLGKSFGANTRTAVSLFTKFIHDGTLKRPLNPDKELETDFSKFSEEEDPDAAFRPFVTPYHSSRPDENCGKVEEVGA